jgi:hypothetical protein
MTPEQFSELLRAASGQSVWHIIIGAVLALAGGFLATVWQEWRNQRARRRTVTVFACDVLDSMTGIFGELVDYQGQTGIVWISILDRLLEEYPTFQRNREHLISFADPRIRRELQTIVFKVNYTANLLKGAVLEAEKVRAAPAATAPDVGAQAAPDPAVLMVRHRLEQLRAHIDQARDLRQRLARRKRENG